MNTVTCPELKIKALTDKKKAFHLVQKDNNSIFVFDCKFYQKLFLILISVSTILIFPESPKEIEIVCKSHYTREICNVW